MNDMVINLTFSILHEKKNSCKKMLLKKFLKKICHRQISVPVVKSFV